jgi:hypothetical protein
MVMIVRPDGWADTQRICTARRLAIIPIAARRNDSYLRDRRLATIVRAVLGGRANLVELDVSGPEGRLQGLSLRLFDPKQERWTLNFSNAAAGTLVPPMTGGFGGGARGVFYSAEDFGEKKVLVRFVIESTSADSCRFEQAFSADGGVTWETNWIAVDTRS